MIKLPPNLIAQLGPDSFYGRQVDPLPRLQLVTKGMYVDKGKIKPGHYGIPFGQFEIEDLGPSIDIIPLARRPKALDTCDDPPTAVYDADSPEFKEIRQRAAEKDSGCMWGVSFLVIVGSRFCEFYCGNKSGREIAPDLAEFLPLTEADIAARNLDAKPREARPLTLQSELTGRSDYSWHIPIIAECSEWSGNLPNDLAGEIERFVQHIFP